MFGLLFGGSASAKENAAGAAALQAALHSARTDGTGEFTLEALKLDRVPADLFVPSNAVLVRSLTLRQNNLKAIPVEIGQLTSLHTLILAANKLTDLPQQLGLLSNLKTLNVSSNLLERVPVCIAGLVTLTTLNLSDNPLVELSSRISSLANLQVLNLSSTQIARLPNDLGRLVNLQQLDLKFCTKTQHPPPYIVALGLSEVLQYLREQGDIKVPLDDPSDPAPSYEYTTEQSLRQHREEIRGQMLDDQANVVRISQQLQQRTAEREFVERERRRELEEETARMLLDAEEKRRQQRRMLDEQVRSEQEQRAVQLQAQTKRRQDELKMSAQVVQEAQEAAVREAIFRTADALAQQDRLRTQLQDDETRRVQLSQSVELCRLERDAKQRQELQTSAEQRLKDLLENQRREKEKEQQLAALRLDRDFRDIELAAREQLEESTRRIAAMIEVEEAAQKKMANNVHQQKIAELKEQQAIIKRHQAEESTWMFQLQNVMKDRHQVLMGLLKEQEIEAEQARQALLKYIEEMKSKLDSIRLSVEEESRQRAMEAEIRAIEVEMLDRRRQLAIWEGELANLLSHKPAWLELPESITALQSELASAGAAHAL